jgi:hypothetical protein
VTEQPQEQPGKSQDEQHHVSVEEAAEIGAETQREHPHGGAPGQTGEHPEHPHGEPPGQAKKDEPEQPPTGEVPEAPITPEPTHPIVEPEPPAPAQQPSA